MLKNITVVRRKASRREASQIKYAHETRTTTAITLPILSAFGKAFSAGPAMNMDAPSTPGHMRHRFCLASSSASRSADDESTILSVVALSICVRTSDDGRGRGTLGAGALRGCDGS